MKYIFLALFYILFSSSLNALSISNKNLDNAVRNVMGENNYALNAKFIERLFGKASSYLDGENANYYRICRALKQNGLLKTNFGSPQILEVSFLATSAHKAFSLALFESLRDMGYYSLTNRAINKNGDSIQITINLTAEYAMDPVILQEKLASFGFKAINIKRILDNSWSYTFTPIAPNLPKASTLKAGEQASSANLKGEYWFRLNDIKSLEIISTSQIWYPNVIFYDKNMNIIAVQTSEEKIQAISISVPSGANFMRVGDMFLPSNIKSGISINPK